MSDVNFSSVGFTNFSTTTLSVLRPSNQTEERPVLQDGKTDAACTEHSLSQKHRPRNKTLYNKKFSNNSLCPLAIIPEFLANS